MHKTYTDMDLEPPPKVYRVDGLLFDRIDFEKIDGQVLITWNDGSTVWLDADEWAAVVAHLGSKE